MLNRIWEVLKGALRTFREEGPAAFFQRVSRWLGGERRFAPVPPVIEEPPVDPAVLWGHFQDRLEVPVAGKRVRFWARYRRPLISVLIRTRNRPLTLRYALHSLTLQETRDFEVVVVNDAGEDVAALLHEFEPFYPIQYVQHAEPRYIGATSNTALSVMRGQYFVHLDDDDVLYPHHLATFQDAIQRLPEARVLYSTYARVLMQETAGRLRTLEYLPIAPWPFDAEALLYSNFITIHASVMHRDILQHTGGYDPDMRRLIDWDFLIRASKHTPFVPVEGITCEYRFYLELAEARMTNREATLQSLREIYDKYPSDNPHTLTIRAEQLAGLEMHIRQCAKWQAEVDAGRMTRDQLRWAIMRMIIGFSGDGTSGA